MPIQTLKVGALGTHKALGLAKAKGATFLLARGHEVVCMDNLLTGAMDNIAGFSTAPGFSFVRHDVTEYVRVEGPLEYVLHFASPASPRD